MGLQLILGDFDCKKVLQSISVEIHCNRFVQLMTVLYMSIGSVILIVTCILMREISSVLHFKVLKHLGQLAAER